MSLNLFRQYFAAMPADMIATLQLYPNASVDPECGIVHLGNGVWCEPFLFTRLRRTIGGDRSSEHIGWRALSEVVVPSYDSWEPATEEEIVVAEVHAPLSECALEVELAMKRHEIQNDMQGACLTMDCNTCQGTGMRNILSEEPCLDCRGSALTPKADKQLEPFRI